MDGQRKASNELLAISHSANLSDGRMYPTEVDLLGQPIDRAYAEDRMRNLAADRNQADQGTVRDPSRALAQ